MTDVVLHHITHKKHRNEHTDTRIDEVERIVGLRIEPGYEVMVYELDGCLQKDSRQATGYTDKEGENHHHIPFLQLHQAVSEWSQYILYEES